MKDIKNIWYINKYAMPPQYEPRLRTMKFTHYLQQMGYKVTIFGSSVMHNMNMDLIEDNSMYIERQYDDLHYVHIKSCQYQKSGIKRVWSEIQFHYRLVKLFKHFEKPDMVIATTFPIVANPILNYCRKNGIKYVKETLDWWPDGFVNYGLIGANNPITKYLFWRQRYDYEHVDASVISVKGFRKYFEEKGWDKEHGGPLDMGKFYYINNGVDLSDFDTWKSQFTLDDDDLKSEKRKVIYLGSIRLVNNVMQLVKAAEQLQDREDVEFLIYGDGDDREPLIAYCREHKLANVKFKEKWIDPKYVPYVLSQSYVNLLNYISSEFGKYGISSSKMFQYMASGRPIVCNIDFMYSDINEKHLGVCHEMKDAKDYAEAIRSILDLPLDEYEAMCKRAREAARIYDYPYLTRQMVDVIKSLE